MFSVVSSDTHPEHRELFRKWCLAEWGNIDSFNSDDKGMDTPSPLLVVSGRKLIGGLAFTSYPVPGESRLGLWINALIVAPEYRGRGIGSELIVFAEAEARRLGVGTLFVYTSARQLYQKQSWVELSQSSENYVLKKVLSCGGRT